MTNLQKIFMRKFIERCFAIFFLLLISFSSKAFAANPDSTKLKFGFVLPLTGIWSEFGRAQQNALDLARSDHPELFSNIEFIYEDGAYDGSVTISAFNKLKTTDKVKAVFVFGVEPALILSPLAESAKVPLIARATVASASVGRQYVIRSINYSEQYSKRLLDFFRSQNIRNIGLIQAEISFYNLLTDGLRRNLLPLESLTTVDSFAPADLGLQSSVAKLRFKKFDAIGLYLTPPQIIKACREIKNLHLSNLTLFGATSFQSSSLVAQCDGVLEGAFYTHNTVSEVFRTHYLEKFKNDSQLPWAANAYDVAVLLGEILNSESETIASDEIMSKLKFAGKRLGAGGEYSFQDSKEGGKYFEYPLAVFRIEGQKHRIVFQ